MRRERAVAVLVAVALHVGVIAAALSLPRTRPASLPPSPAPPPLRLWVLQRAAAASPPARQVGRGPASALQVPEREIIDEGHGVTLTIQGGSGADAGVAGPGIATPPAAERWLRAEVWVPAGPQTAPRPSDYCLPREPEMPELAVERNITGRVEVSYTVDADGVVGEVALLSDAPLVLSRAVRGWLQGCLFEPATLGSKRMPARVTQTFVFKIR
jgi:hypothetical protein